LTKEEITKIMQKGEIVIETPEYTIKEYGGDVDE